MRYKKNLGVMLTKQEGEFYAVYNCEVFKLNETGARVLELCNNKNDVVDIIHKLSKYFDIEEEKIRSDIEEYLLEMEKMELVKNTIK